jgi:hypothetical protein
MYHVCNQHTSANSMWLLHAVSKPSKNQLVFGNTSQSGLVGLPKISRVKFKKFKNVEKMLKKTITIKKIFGEKVHRNNEHCTVKKFQVKMKRDNKKENQTFKE